MENKDLWEELLSELERWEASGIRVQFWHVRRDLNAAADALAKEGAQVKYLPFTHTFRFLLISL